MIHSPPDLIEVLGAAGDDEIAVRIDARKIAGRKPAVGIGGGRLLAEIALDHRGAAHAQMPFDAALLRQRRWPSASVSSRSTPTAGRPDNAPDRGAIAGGATVPDGDSSVMPQLVCTVTPRRRSMRSISAGGIGAPPTMMRSSVGTSPPARLEMLDEAEPDGRHADRDRHGLVD